MHESYYKRPLLWLLILYIAGLFCFYTPSPGKRDVYHHISSQPVTLTGKVIGFPTLKKKSTNLILQVISVDGQKANGKVYARFMGDVPRWHEMVQINGKLKKPYSIHLLGNFDWAEYLATKNIFTEIQVSSYQSLNSPNWFFRAIYRIREDILTTFEQHFERNLSAIAGGVLLGERGEIGEQLYTDFQDSGAIHLLVASGGNVGFVTLVVFAFCSLFAMNRRKTILLALTIAGVYTLIAGADAPLMRAYFMTVCAVVGYFFHRNSGVFQGLILACFLILLGNPSAVFEMGFQMSFLATLAIIICLHTYELPYSWPRWVKFFVQIFLATLSTQLVLLPVFTNVFFKVSAVGLIANMILVPWASLLMAVSFAFYAFSVLHIGFVLQAITGWLLSGFAWLVQFFASLPFASWPASAWRTGSIIAYYAGIFFLFHLPLKNFCKRMYKPILCLMIAAPLIQMLLFNAPTVWLLNEWNQNSILLRMPNRKYFLIGAELEADKLNRAVRKAGGSLLEAVLLNERTEKQLKNVQLLQQKMPVKTIIIPFDMIWPEEEIKIDKVTVLAQWGKLLNRQQKLWENKGYSGNRDNISYQFTKDKLSFTTAGNNRFILWKNKILENKQNNTCCLKL